MDHHCPWVNTCIGFLNEKYFFKFLLFSVIGCIHGSILLIHAFYQIIKNPYIFYKIKSQQYYLYLTHVFSIGLIIGIIFFLSFLLYQQFICAICNITSIEKWILEKIKKYQNKNFENPYNVGKVANLKQFFSSSLLNGYDWPVKSGYGIYSLSIEQINLKAFKFEHSLTYQCNSSYDISYIYISWNFGCYTLLTSPVIGDSDIIKCVKEDYVQITHWRKKWLYGTKIGYDESKDEFTDQDIKGWFPRQCFWVANNQKYKSISSSGCKDVRKRF